MPNALPFERLARRDQPSLTVFVDDTPVKVYAGDSVAAAVLAAGCLPSRRTAVSGDPRAPYCLMGACFECLLTIDDRPNQQGCMTEVRDQMRITFQSGVRPTQEIFR
ncbi:MULTISPECIES: (2Fe-2S)-binding protein [unclassified Halomonas]|uniref:(2Fe-2S)-binding protein n=1 Tax=unclassified Halomonas TaxID=2609666 RepID=UPI0005FA0129|nr:MULTISPECIES: (2Fe-2S)-binding protein [unclassified Halomonas]KJZ09993.1 hypothetical protein TW86_14480 [Halomonas sp. S2151]MCJ8287735.1 (2Fe-2S)-binding protein [Halomonas sp.]MCO7216632.1 (2Fe-2S)-binding protein [Halomonas sp. OfavH-34-E]